MSVSGNGVMTTDPIDQQRSSHKTHTAKEELGEARSVFYSKSRTGIIVLSLKTKEKKKTYLILS